MAQSRESRGSAFLDTYLKAPLWRFWWSQSVGGAGAAGVLMPSVDKVGRYFPVTAIALAQKGEDFRLPTVDDDGWYGSVENALLGALSQTDTLAALLSRLEALAPLPRAHEKAAEGSLWWTIGGGGLPPQRAAWPGLPPPYAFTVMLSGRSPMAEQGMTNPR